MHGAKFWRCAECLKLELGVLQMIKMIQSPNQRSQHLLVAAITTVGVAASWFWLTWRYGFDLADEGYYWYGAQRVLRGEVPIRDFMSYDIGRYYWAAFFMYLIGSDGIFTARLSAFLFQVSGTFVGVYLCLFSMRKEGLIKWTFALLVASILTVWVNPYYKAFDHATSEIIVGAIVLLVKFHKPSAWFASGVCLGVAAMIGRNHGVYGALSFAGVILYLYTNALYRAPVVKLCPYFAIGVLLGFAPTLIMMIFADGFAAAFVNSIIVILTTGATNIGLPVPWPWSANLRGNGFLIAMMRCGIGIGFVFLIAMPFFGMVILARKNIDLRDNRQIVLLAATAAAIPYSHYAFSRADATHLALGIFPALIGLMAVGGVMTGLKTLALAAFVLLGSTITVSKLNLYLSAHLLGAKLLQTEVDGQSLWTIRSVTIGLNWAREALAGQDSVNFLAIPDMPGLYAIQRKKMPLWEIYPLTPQSSKFESGEINRLQSSMPDLVLLSDHALDGNPQFRYSYMHPFTYAWILSNYKLLSIEGPTGQPDFKVFLREY